MTTHETDPLLHRALLLGKEAGELLDRAARFVPQTQQRHRVSFLQAEVRFLQAQYQPQNIVFNVPAGPALDGQRLSLYPFARLVDQVAPARSDRTFRPTFWAWQTLRAVDRLASVDAFVEVILQEKGKPQVALQTSPVPAQQLFSGVLRQAFLRDSFEVGPGHVFSPCLHLPPQSSLTVRVTPFFAASYVPPAPGEGEPADTRVYEYALVGVLEGSKVVR